MKSAALLGKAKEVLKEAYPSVLQLIMSLAVQKARLNDWG